MALQFAASPSSEDQQRSDEAMSLYEVERVIAQSLADGKPRDPANVISEARAKGAEPLAVVKEALWSLIGAGVVEITEQYQLLRVK